MIDNINIITCNVRGIKQKSIELFDNLIDKNIHICLVTESRLKLDVCLSHNKFFICRNGVAIIIRKNIAHSMLSIV